MMVTTNINVERTFDKACEVIFPLTNAVEDETGYDEFFVGDGTVEFEDGTLSKYHFFETANAKYYIEPLSDGTVGYTRIIDEKVEHTDDYEFFLQTIICDIKTIWFELEEYIDEFIDDEDEF